MRLATWPCLLGCSRASLVYCLGDRSGNGLDSAYGGGPGDRPGKMRAVALFPHLPQTLWLVKPSSFCGQMLCGRRRMVGDGMLGDSYLGFVDPQGLPGPSNTVGGPIGY